LYVPGGHAIGVTVAFGQYWPAAQACVASVGTTLVPAGQYVPAQHEIQNHEKPGAPDHKPLTQALLFTIAIQEVVFESQ
jgi:hypothetical protein